MSDLTIRIKKTELEKMVWDMGHKLNWIKCECCGFLDIGDPDELIPFLTSILDELGVELIVKEGDQ